MTIHSEAFKNAYAIFFNQKKVPLIKEIIKRNNLQEADVFKATFDKNIAMIVLPHTSDVKETEKLLYDQSCGGDGEGFWGQIGVGYKGRRWEKV
jgi:hypothetical protein